MKALLLTLLLFAFAGGAASADDYENPITTYQSKDDIGGGDDLQKIDLRSVREDRKDDEDARGGQSPDKGVSDTGDQSDGSDYGAKSGRSYRFGGSEFTVSDFVDTDFSKHLFRDLFQDQKKIDSIDRVERSLKPDDDAMRGDDLDSLLMFAEERRKRAIEDRRERLLRNLMEPHYGTPGDWVPSNLDPINNGGFTTAADNGFPVPYRLNGHLDFQRKRPWQDKGD